MWEVDRKQFLTLPKLYSASHLRNIGIVSVARDRKPSLNWLK